MRSGIQPWIYISVGIGVRSEKKETWLKEASHNKRQTRVTYVTHVSHLDTVATKTDFYYEFKPWALGHRPWRWLGHTKVERCGAKVG